MAKIILKQHVHAQRSKYTGAITFHLFDSPCMQEFGYVPLFDQDFEIEIPDDFDLTPIEIAQLQEAKKAVQAACNKKLMEIEEEIQKLLCIEHKPEVVL